jgi:hypothetical protein
MCVILARNGRATVICMNDVGCLGSSAAGFAAVASDDMTSSYARID